MYETKHTLLRLFLIFFFNVQMTQVPDLLDTAHSLHKWIVDVSVYLCAL